MSDRRRTAAVGLLAVALFVSACAGIPTSGPVHEAGGFVNERDDPVTRIVAQPPRPGMTPEQVVEGFLQASASFDDDHAVARLFLSSQAARSWDASGVTVYDSSQAGSAKFVATAPDKVRFTAPEAGTISPQGEYTDAPDGTMTAADFALVRVSGQWRISALPAGLLLTTYDVGRAYRTYDVYFPDPSRTVMVPDQILVPVGPGISTTLVRSLLTGPTPWLAPAVRTAIPAGTKLVVDSVPVRDGVAQIDLTAAAANALGADAIALSAQFVWTLRQLSGITSVRLTVEGVPLRVPRAGDVQGIDSWPTFDPDGQTASAAAYFENEQRLWVQRGDRPERALGPAGDGSVPLARVAVSFGEAQVAGIDPSGRHLIVGRLAADGKLATVLTGTALSTPSWDRFDSVWTVDRTPAGPVLWQVPRSGTPQQVAVTGAGTAGLVELRVARDGVRVAALVKGTAGGQVLLGRLERSQGGAVVLAGLRPLATQLVDVRDVAWATSDRLVLLAADAVGASARPTVVDLSGSTVQSLGPVADSVDLVSVTAAPTNPVMAGSADGRLWWYTGFGWDSPGRGTSPAYPG